MTSANLVLIKLSNLISRSLCFMGNAKYVRSLSDLRLVFYHGIGNNNSPCLRYMKDEISEKVFKSQIEYLIEKYEILSLDDAITKVEEPALVNKKPICSISFDDGLKSVYGKAFPLFRKKNIPAVVFLNTSVIGNTSLLWTHMLNYLIFTFGIKKVSCAMNKNKSKNINEAPEDVILIQDWYRKNYAVNCYSELPLKLMNHFGLSISEVAKEQDIYLTWKEISEMEKNGFIFCSHTQNHTPLAVLNEEHRKDEIHGAYATLREHGYNLDFVSFPFGMKVDYGELAIKCAFDAGHKYVLEVGSGTNEFKRVKESKVFSRVGLGVVSSKKSDIFSAIELRPRIKTLMKQLI